MAEINKQPGASMFVLWNSLSTPKKISIIVFTAAFLSAAGLFINYFTTPKMGILFRGLNNDSAASVLARLDDLSVPYTLKSGGQEILVAQNRIDELRITLSSDGGLYGGGTGFELFDKTKLGVSEAERRLNYQRALQGELQRTIAQLDGISQARVHLVIPEPSFFIREASPATASVVLKLNPLSQLRSDQVMGIVYLIAGSVENLTPENITIIDTQGRVLSRAGSEGGAAGDYNTSTTLRHLDIKKTFEKELEFRLQGMLERVLGGGTVSAMVTANLDFDSQETTEIIYGEPVLRSSSRIKEEFEGSGSLPMGEAGTESNIPVYANTDSLQGESRYSRLDEIENYEISETLTHSIKAPGEIKSISASVIYDNSRGTLTTRQMQDLENLVASALGLSEQRGDRVSVASIPFDTTFLEETIIAMEQAAKADKTEKYIRYGLTGAVVFAVLMILMAFLGRVRYFLTEQTSFRTVAATMQHSIMTEGVPQVYEQDNLAMRVKNITQKNPETAISLLKVWLAEDQR
ncbi:MAG: flagellar M-ring protein FliF [Dethiobacter sp.]|nr:flagellar M-ring protein FliF [Dethiobacter sp.]